MVAVVTTPDWIPIAAVALAAVLALVGSMAAIILADLRGEVRRAVSTLEAVLGRQESQESRISWLEGFHPSREQAARAWHGNGRGGD